MSSIGLPKLRSGKVRDVYEIGHDRLLMVASDRISAFDVVLEEPIPDKGRVLTGLSTFWFDKTSDLVPNHLISADPTDFPETAGPDAAGRAMMVRAARPVLMECVVRGYLFGSAWSEYQKQGTVNGEPLPAGMVLAEPLPEPIFTPTTKADEGHDTALTRDDAIGLVGQEPLRGAVRPLDRHLQVRHDRRLDRGASCWPIRSSSSGRSTGNYCSSTRSSRPTRRGSGPPTSTSPVRHPRASTSSSSASTSSTKGGTAHRPRRPCPTMWSRAPGPATSRPTSG